MKALADVQVVMASKNGLSSSSLAKQLVMLGATVQNRSCEEVSADLQQNSKISLIIFDNLQNDNVCENMKTVIKKEAVTASVPVFVLIEDSEEQIQNAIVLDVADYITKTEDIDSITQKITAVLHEDTVFAGNATIDITPEKTVISSTGIKVYVVEDDPLLRNLLSIKLDNSSFPNEFSKNGDGALAAMQQFEPDTIILDLMLPGMSGFDILKQVKADPKLENVPVIVFSNKDSSADKKKAEDLGADCFYIKAMTDLSDLVEKIESLVLQQKQKGTV